MAQEPISHYLCIGCPLGCRLEVEEGPAGDIVEVRGWACKRGDKYARQEHTDPRRMVTTTVRLSGGMWARLPVKTNVPVPKGRIGEVCHQLREVTVETPVRTGDVVVKNVLDLEADIVATRDAAHTS